jgi:hypothetical protein
MIIFISNSFHCYNHSALCSHTEVPDVRSESYDWLLRRRTLPRATYIFTDRERMDSWQIKTFQHYYNYINRLGDGYRAINNPGKMMNRRALLRTLYSRGLNPFNVYAVTERRAPERYPVFIRNEYDHGKPLTGLLQTPEELNGALHALAEQGCPEDGLLITEYCARPLEGDLFRKLSSYRVGNQLFFFGTVHQRDWLVKYGTLNSATQAMYEDELSMIAENACREQLLAMFTAGQIEYGRADFGLVDGRVVLYEINTNPNTQPPTEKHPNATRRQSIEAGWKKYCEALHQVDTPAAGKNKKALLKIPGLKRPRPTLSFSRNLRFFRP